MICREKEITVMIGITDCNRKLVYVADLVDQQGITLSHLARAQNIRKVYASAEKLNGVCQYSEE